jgi:toxin CcdB
MLSGTACRWRSIASSDAVARFDLYRLAEGQGYVVDVQSDHASEMVGTRVVAPLMPVEEIGPLISELNPVLRIGDRD